MPKLITRKSQKAGLPPGSLVHLGERKAKQVVITILDFDENQFEEKQVKAIEESFPFKDKSTVTWINIDGLHDVDIVARLGKHFGLHPLIMEDILNTDHRPKMEDYGGYIFIVLKMLCLDEDTEEVEAEQVSLILGTNFVISFQEHEGDVFDSIRDRIKRHKGRIRKEGADYLAYALLDAIVDNYFVILEHVDERLENTEQELATNPSPATLGYIRHLKKQMIALRRSIWPLRELVSGLQRGESTLIQKSTLVYLRDVYDHTIQIIDTIESARDTISGMVDIYLSGLSNKMNEVMKVLTIFASIFIPLTFVAGVYGMNFEYMPELGWRWSYFSLLGLMALMGIGMVVYFKRKKWF